MNDLAYTPHDDRADAQADRLVNLSNRLHELAGELRSAAVVGVVL